MNKLLATLLAGAFVASSTLALAQTTATPAPAAPATPAAPAASSSGSMKADTMNHDSTKKSTKNKRQLRGPTGIHETNLDSVKAMLPYA